MRTLGYALFLLLAATTLWQAIAHALEMRAHPPHGVFADAGGFRLRLLPSGAGQNGPTVLLETGIGGATSVTWSWVQRGVERFAPVVSYDRAGLGDSDPGPMPRDGVELVTEFHTALVNAGYRGPYVFVGHSYGGLLARLFADRYPDEVAGVVLVESSHAAQFRGRGPRGVLRVMRTLVPAAPWVARLGLTRAVLTFVKTDADLLPPAARKEQRAFLGSPRHWNGVVREMGAWGPLTSPQAAAARDLGDRPLAVLTAEVSAKRFPGWKGLQSDHSRLSTDSFARTVAGATHGSILADSSHAEHVITAIHDVFDAVRLHRRVAELVSERGH